MTQILITKMLLTKVPTWFQYSYIIVCEKLDEKPKKILFESINLGGRCLYCGKSINNKKYCDNKCQGLWVFENVTIPKFKRGLLTHRRIIKKVLKYTKGEKCEICGVTNWEGKPLSFVLDHINGNAGDHRSENVRIICPNCDSQTPTFGGRNIGNGRKARGLAMN